VRMGREADPRSQARAVQVGGQRGEVGNRHCRVDDQAPAVVGENRGAAARQQVGGGDQDAWGDLAKALHSAFLQDHRTCSQFLSPR
jgi:hypothetical protein